MPGAEVNSNYHSLSGNILDRVDSRFKEYRKKWDQQPKRFSAGEFPLFIDIEVTSSCNLKCPFCATTFRSQEIKKGYIGFDTVKKIIDEGAENDLYGVKFNIRGEPLLHPRIAEFVRYAKKKGLVDVYFNTNAMLLTEEMSKKLIEAGLDRISVSFEGCSKDTYEQRRVGASYETVLDNIRNLQLLKKKLKAEHPKLRVQTVMLPDCEFTADEYKKFWEGKVDEIGFLDYKEMKLKKKNVLSNWACPQIWQRMAVLWDATILPCNHDDEALLSLGKIGETTLGEVWNSKKLNQIRDTHKQGRAHEISACNGCYLRDSEMTKFKEGKL